MTKIAVVTGNPKPDSRTHSVALAVAAALAKELPGADTDPVIDARRALGDVCGQVAVLRDDHVASGVRGARVSAVGLNAAIARAKTRIITRARSKSSDAQHHRCFKISAHERPPCAKYNYRYSRVNP